MQQKLCRFLHNVTYVSISIWEWNRPLQCWHCNI